MKEKKYRSYYILGGILLGSGIVIALCGLSLTLIFPESQIAGWVGMAICIVAIILCFFSIYLLKKGNFLKLNAVLDNKTSENHNKKR